MTAHEQEDHLCKPDQYIWIDPTYSSTPQLWRCARCNRVRRWHDGRDLGPAPPEDFHSTHELGFSHIGLDGHVHTKWQRSCYSRVTRAQRDRALGKSSDARHLSPTG